MADASYFSEANVAASVAEDIAALIAPGRESHHLPWQGSQGQGVALLGAPRMQRFSEPPPSAQDPRRARVGRRFRQFLLRGA